MDYQDSGLVLRIRTVPRQEHLHLRAAIFMKDDPEDPEGGIELATIASKCCREFPEIHQAWKDLVGLTFRKSMMTILGASGVRTIDVPRPDTE